MKNQTNVHQRWLCQQESCTQIYKSIDLLSKVDDQWVYLCLKCIGKLGSVGRKQSILTGMTTVIRAKYWKTKTVKNCGSFGFCQNFVVVRKTFNFMVSTTQGMHMFGLPIRLSPPANEVAGRYYFNRLVSVCHSVGVPCDHYPWCIGPHCTTPRPDMGFHWPCLPLETSSDHHRRPIQTCSF